MLDERREQLLPHRADAMHRDDRVRVVVTLTGIVFSVVLSAIQLGLFVGFSRATSDLIRYADADVWVMSRGIGKLENAVPFPEQRLYQVAALPGVVLGLRGIRRSLLERDVFISQLTAVWRAATSACGSPCIRATSSVGLPCPGTKWPTRSNARVSSPAATWSRCVPIRKSSRK